MANDRISQIEAQIERIFDQLDQRDAERAQLRNAATECLSGIGALGDGARSLESRISALENKPVPTSPGALAYWGPAVTTALAIAGLAGWGMSKTVGPIEEDLSELKGTVHVIEDRQFATSKSLAFSQAEIIALRKQIDAIDYEGSRKWVGKEK